MTAEADYRLILAELTTRNLIAEVEGVLGVAAAYPITSKALETLQAIADFRKQERMEASA